MVGLMIDASDAGIRIGNLANRLETGSGKRKQGQEQRPQRGVQAQPYPHVQDLTGR